MNNRSIDGVSRTIAERLFDSSSARAELEDQLEETGVEFTKIGWDWYDNSLEIYGVPDEARLSEAQQRICHAAGFSKVYVNHAGKDRWETHYGFKGAEFKVSKGWRVSYPHKRDDGSKDIWVEEHIAGWPAEWFKTGYVKIKQWLTQP